MSFIKRASDTIRELKNEIVVLRDRLEKNELENKQKLANIKRKEIVQTFPNTSEYVEGMSEDGIDLIRDVVGLSKEAEIWKGYDNTSKSASSGSKVIEEQIFSYLGH